MTAPRRILFVFAWLVVGGEETEVRLLAKHLDPRRWRIDVVACFRKPNMPEQTHDQLAALGVDIDKTPYALSFTETVAYLAEKARGYDLVVACQAVPDIVPALDLIGPGAPPLIEHGGLIAEALRGPKHRTARYVGVCDSIRAAAASTMPDPAHALEIPSMVDLDEFATPDREGLRAQFGIAPGAPLVGWVGRLDRKKRVEDFVEAAALVRAARPNARFLVVGGPDAFMPEYEGELRDRVAALGLDEAAVFTGDRVDVPRLLSALDVFVWLARGEGMPHVIAEAGAAGLPVVCTRDNGTAQQIEHGRTGLFVAHEAPLEAAEAVLGLLADPARARSLGAALEADVRARYAVRTVMPRWEALFEVVIAKHGSA